MDFYGFYTGTVFNAYEYLGAHRQDKGYVFRVFAPSAQRVTLFGDFTDWREWEMNRINDGNFFEVYAESAEKGMKYFHRIYDRHGGYTDHCDIYGFGMELRPDHRSVLRDLNSYSFNDEKWMSSRTDCKNKPLNIYEMHMGSWRKKGSANDNTDNENNEDSKESSWYTYDELADILIPYVKEAGYNYIEFMPLSEHPCDESWGYQNTGFFSPTSRYGSAEQLMELVDKCHQNNIGVIMDFVPVHFAVDSYGIGNYDGTALYEYPHSDVGISEWGSSNFMHSRGEVRSFLQSCAYYWLKEFHFDGIRMDAISRIIYWQGEESRGVNGRGVEFIKVMNKGIKERIPNCILIAEDSTNYRGITAPADSGGLGFDYKWDMGFMNDTLNYFRTAPEYRSQEYHKLTFSMMYYYNENYLLPFSHDENVHGKATILQKMNGQYEDKFPQGRALYLYMYVHPGKKLNFMGGEIGQLREWDESREQDWDILKYPNHDSFYAFMKALNKLYLTHSALYEADHDRSGFRWLDCDNTENCIYAIERKSGSETLAAVFNFSDSEKEYSLSAVSGYSEAKVLIHTDWYRFGGNSEEKAEIDLENIILPKFSGILIKAEAV